MKQKFSILSILAFCVSIFLSQHAGAQQQIPDNISYQAVIRDADGNLVRNQTIGMQISFLVGSPSGGIDFIETHNPTTNENGLVSIQIGGGTPVLSTITNARWRRDLFLKTEIDLAGGTNYTITGTTELLSVPYALWAKEAENVVDYTAGHGITILEGEISAFDQYSVGLNTALGGYVFYVTPDGKHGLVVETQDQGEVSWYNAQNTISNPDNHSTAGKNFTDWRLPTLHELGLMYSQKSLIPINGYYWSSTQWYNEGSPMHAWLFNFNDGSSNGGQVLYGAEKVRAVRSF